MSSNDRRRQRLACAEASQAALCRRERLDSLVLEREAEELRAWLATPAGRLDAEAARLRARRALGLNFPEVAELREERR